MRSQSPEETLHRVRCLSEGRVNIIQIPVVFAPETGLQVNIEHRPMTGAERAKRWREGHKQS